MLAELSTASSRVPSSRDASAGLFNPLDPDRRVAAVLFDLDGTLYDQRRLRALMAAELMTLPLTRPTVALRSWRGLAAFRRAQEQLRHNGDGDIRSWSRRQIERAAADAGLTAFELGPIVDEWMFERPLKYLRVCRAAGLPDFLAFLNDAGVEIGVLSDYPVDMKLRALGIADYFSMRLCSSDADVGALKPSPRGFLRAAERWGLDPADVLVVGDRFDVDAAGALAAGMPAFILRRRRPANIPPRVAIVPSIERLHRVLEHDVRR
jgi:FMN phosphatase YigB (HAD superfamily)